MIKFEADSKRVSGTDRRLECSVEVKKYAHEGTVEQMMGEMSAMIVQWLLATIGDFLAEKGEEDLDSFCALAEQTGKTILLSALANAAMHWAEEHDIPVEMDDLAARFAESLGGEVQDEPAEQYVN